MAIQPNNALPRLFRRPTTRAGHIRKPQEVGDLDHIRYCGSPIRSALTKARQAKCCWRTWTPTAWRITARGWCPCKPWSVSGNLMALASAIGAGRATGLAEVAVAEDYLSRPATAHQRDDARPADLGVLIFLAHASTAATLAEQPPEAWTNSAGEVFARRLAQA